MNRRRSRALAKNKRRWRIAAFVGGTAGIGVMTYWLLRRARVRPAGVPAIALNASIVSQLNKPRLRLRESGTVAPRINKSDFTPWKRPASTTGSLRRFKTVDALLASCPTDAEQAKIRADFDVRFGPGVVAPWSCTQNGIESSVMLTIYNMFRLAYTLDFDTPMPVIGVTNVYGWLKTLNLIWYFRRATPDDPYSHAGGNGEENEVSLVAIDETASMGDLPSRYNPVFAYPYPHALPGPGNEPIVTSVMNLPNVVLSLAVSLHEARHTVRGGSRAHPCGRPPMHGNPAEPYTADPSLEWGGAWAVQYWFMLWCSQHAGQFFNATQRQTAGNEAQQMRGLDFCDEFDTRKLYISTAPHR